MVAPPRPQTNTNQSNGFKPHEDEQAQHDYIQSLIKGIVPPARPYFNEAELGIIKNAERKARDSRENERSRQRLIEQSPLKHLLKTPRIEVVRDERSYPPLPAGLLFSTELTKGILPCREEYIRYSKKVSPEGYEDFHEAAFWSLLSTVAARRIKIPISTPQYTPLYIILTARSTLFAKTATANVMRKLLKAADLDWLLGSARTTPQKLLSEMAGTIPTNYGELTDEQERERIKRRLAMSGQRGWYYNEFGKFVKSMLKPNSPMADFNELLLTMDDCDDQFEYATQVRGIERIAKPYLSLLGSMTPSSIREHTKAGAESWTDGFNARLIFVTPSRGEAALDAPFGLDEPPLPWELVHQLEKWNEELGVPLVEIDSVRDDKGKETGKYELTRIRELPETSIPPTIATYEAWKRYRSALKDIHKKFNHDDLDASYGRLPIKALRVAGLAASFEGSHMIEIQHWAVAQEVTERWRASLHEMYAQVNAPDQAPTIEDKILEAVAELKEKEIDRNISLPFALPTARDIGRKLHKSIRDIDPYVSSLARNKVLKKVPVGDTSRYDLAEGINENE